MTASVAKNSNTHALRKTWNDLLPPENQKSTFMSGSSLKGTCASSTIRHSLYDPVTKRVEYEFNSVIDSELAKYPNNAAFDRTFTQAESTRHGSVRKSTHNQCDNPALLGG
jgi:hypothetical protein